eukprot:TRINITY_DN1634_c0_g1_i2.p1 TRINITY_DN1634_c0_g1~~TRINITY_DN1634_c0_g1_i2.p1  ORF type:complete len:203 (+),score=28.48 TRINITY_DN1634_c0_g1_i2:57-665(+)
MDEHKQKDNYDLHIDGPSTRFSPLSDKHTNDHAVTVVLKEKIFSLTGDSFKIQDTNGNDVFQLKGKLVSLHQRKVLKDMEGNSLGVVRKRMVSVHKRQNIYDADEKKIAFAARKHFLQFHANAVIKIKSTEEEITVKGSIFAHDFKFYMGDTVIAYVHRGILNARNIIAGKDSYQLTVAPNVDLAFMILATICLDEIFCDKD